MDKPWIFYNLNSQSSSKRKLTYFNVEKDCIAAPRTRHRQFIDCVKVIPANKYKRQLKDTSDITRKETFALRTKTAMYYRSCELVDRLFTYPGRKISSFKLSKLYASCLNFKVDDTTIDTTTIEPLDFDLRIPLTNRIIPSDKEGLPTVSHQQNPTFSSRNSGPPKYKKIKRNDSGSLTSIAKIPQLLSKHEEITCELTIQKELEPENKNTVDTKNGPNVTDPILEVSSQLLSHPVENNIQTERREDTVEDFSISDSSKCTLSEQHLNISEVQDDNVSTEIVFCIEEGMSEFILVGENGETYRVITSSEGNLTFFPPLAIDPK